MDLICRERQAFARSCTRLINGVPQLDKQLLYDPRMIRFSGQEKVCIKEKKGVWVAEYRFGPVNMVTENKEKSDTESSMMNEFESRFRKYWTIVGDSNMVICECESLEELLACIAYKEAYFAVYLERRDSPIGSVDDAKSFMDEVEDRLSEEEKTILKGAKSRIPKGLDFSAIDEIEEYLGKNKFTKLQDAIPPDSASAEL